MLLATVLACTLVLGSVVADDRPQSFDTGLLWRISGPGIGDSFVLGTIHVPDPRVSTIAKPVADALAQSRMLATELVLGATDTGGVELEEFDDGRRLEPLIGSEAFGLLRAALVEQGVSERATERMKPWAAMLRIARVAPRSDSTSLDEQLLHAARSRRMRVAPLEAVEEQIASFDTVPLDSQVALLKHALVHRDALESTIEPTIDAWLRGDLAALARIADGVGEQFPDMGRHYRQLAKHIIDDRTILMHYRLVMPLREGRVFVAVGAMHLYGEHGLLAMLERDGYRVTRVW
jgi:uncharacterized protein YbaP (TraB family)